VMYARRDMEAFQRTAMAFTIAMTACLVMFCVFPVEGPRYVWPAPPGVPDGPARRLVMDLLAAGSSRGTAFPSSHQAIALVMSLSSMQWDRRLGWPVLVASLLLGVGAVYGGFHYATDMIAGVGIAVAAWMAVRRGPGRATVALV
jgi:membrane-associated phospholipid phosphatase